MADRVRLLVAALFDPTTTAELNGVRRALADRSLARIPPHVTLAPPTNVAAAEVPEVVHRLRMEAGRAAAPLSLGLGPGATFAPANRVVYLEVAPPDGLAALRDGVDVAPFGRDRDRPFVPHVTVARPAPSLVAATVAALSGARFDAVVDGVTLLQEVTVDGVGRRWEVVADAALRASMRLGTGSLPVELWFGTLIEPRLLAALPTRTPSRHDLVVTATLDGEAVGVTAGWTGEEPLVWWVRPDHRRRGVGRAMRRAFD
jgi:2'-5' RNA ligase